MVKEQKLTYLLSQRDRLPVEIKGNIQYLQEIFNLLHLYTDTVYGQVIINCIDAKGGKSLQENRPNALKM